MLEYWVPLQPINFDAHPLLFIHYFLVRCLKHAESNSFVMHHVILHHLPHCIAVFLV